MRTLVFAILALTLSTPLLGAAPPDDPATRTMAERIVVHSPWARLMPPGQPNTAAFMVLENTGEEDIALVAARSPASAVVELHTHLQEDGMMRMREVARIDVPAGGRTELRPGGLHVMLIGLVEPLSPEVAVEITLVFADDSTLALEAPTRHPRDMPGHGGHHRSPPQ